jgi:hypothetical protein
MFPIFYLLEMNHYGAEHGGAHLKSQLLGRQRQEDHDPKPARQKHETLSKAETENERTRVGWWLWLKW